MLFAYTLVHYYIANAENNAKIKPRVDIFVILFIYPDIYSSNYIDLISRCLPETVW